MLILLLLQLKHFVADFFIQTPYMYKNKGTYGHLGGISHSGIHGIFTFQILIWFLAPAQALGLAFLDMVIHYHMDWFKVYWSKKRGYNFYNNEYWVWLGIDQTIHQLTYILIYYMSKF